MRIRIPWPLRRQGGSVPPSTPGSASSSPQAAAAAGDHAPAIDVDAGFAGDFRARARERDGTPFLGPWGGLGETARFAVAATRFPSTLVTRRFSDELMRPEITTGAIISDFIPSLASLASYSDPTGAPGESGSPFADSLPLTRGDLVGATSPVPVAPAIPSFRPASAARGESPSIGRTPDRSSAGDTAARRPQRAPSSGPPVPAQRTIDGPPRGAARSRGLVTESPSPLPSSTPTIAAVTPAPRAISVEPRAPLPPAHADDSLPLASPLPPGETASPVMPAGRPVPPTARLSESPSKVSLTVDSAPPGSRPDVHAASVPADAQRPPATLASDPGHRDFAPAPDLPLAELAASPGLSSNELPPLGAAQPEEVVRSIDAPVPAPLPLAHDFLPTAPTHPQPAAPRAPGVAQPRDSSSTEPATSAAEPLVQRQPVPPLPPLPPDSDVQPLRPPGVPSPVTPRVRRFSVGEAVPAGRPLAPTLSAPPASAAQAGEPPAPAAGLTVGERESALPIARASLIGPGASLPGDSPADDSPSPAGPFPALPLAATFVPGLPLSVPTAVSVPVPPGGSSLPPASAGSKRPPNEAVRRSLDVPDVTAGVGPLLFREPGPAPLPVEPVQAPSPQGAMAGGASPGIERPLFPPTPTALMDLPLARSTSAGPTASSGSTASPGGLTAGVQRIPLPSPGAPAGPSPSAIVWRSADTGASAADAPVESGAAEAVGQIAAGQGQKPAEPDLDKLTEKVWQRIRRTLQLERERHRGLP